MDWGSCLAQSHCVVGRRQSLLGQAGGCEHRWLDKSVRSSQVKEQAGPDPLLPQAAPTAPQGEDTLGEKRGEQMLPVAWGSKGLKRAGRTKVSNWPQTVCQPGRVRKARIRPAGLLSSLKTDAFF